jgi:hypothetical protein
MHSWYEIILLNFLYKNFGLVLHFPYFPDLAPFDFFFFHNSRWHWREGYLMTLRFENTCQNQNTGLPKMVQSLHLLHHAVRKYIEEENMEYKVNTDITEKYNLATLRSNHMNEAACISCPILAATFSLAQLVNVSLNLLLSLHCVLNHQVLDRG